MGTPTLYQNGSFTFESQANVPSEFKNKLKDKAINVLLAVLDYKMTHPTGKLSDHIYFLEGRTGCGKSTILPRELFFHTKRNIRVTIPRVNLVQSVPDDICKQDPNLVMGKNIGFYTGPFKMIPTENPSIRFMTTEIFRQKLIKTKIIAPIIIIDEVHMLDVPTVNTLKVIKDYLNNPSIPNIKKPLFIFQSATINIKLLSNYFLGNYENIRKDFTMIGHIKGTRNFHVEQRSLTLDDETKLNEENITEYIIKKSIPECIASSSRLPGKIPVRDMLIFLYGKRPIEKIMWRLDKELPRLKLPFKVLDLKTNPTESEVIAWRDKFRNKTRILVIPFISGIYSYAHILLRYNVDPDIEARQNEIKVYLSTDALEFGKTIDTLYQVFDSGVNNRVFNKPLLYSPFGKINMTLAPVNKSAVIQRLGRVGRKAPGISTMLYSEKTFDKLQKDPDPDNVNVVSRAATINQSHGFIDLLADNDYISPNSTDTNIRTGQDLIDSCLMTPFGVLISDVHNQNYSLQTWTLKAKELYYLEGEKLLTALLKSRYSRQNLGNLINTNDNKVDFPIKDFTDMKNNPLRNDVVNTILDVRIEYIMYELEPEKTIYV